MCWHQSLYKSVYLEWKASQEFHQNNLRISLDNCVAYKVIFITLNCSVSKYKTIEWPFIRKTLSYFSFGPSILQGFNLFYCTPESCILNNGWTSNFFEIQRGVRQGCPLSQYLFVLTVEILANKIR